MMPILSSLMTSQAVITSCGTASDDKVGIIPTLSYDDANFVINGNTTQWVQYSYGS